MELNGRNRLKPEMTWQQRKQLYFTLESRLKLGPLPRGTFTGMSRDYPVKPATLSVLWRELRKKVEDYLQIWVAPGVHVDITANRTVALPDYLFHTNKMNAGTEQNSQKYDTEELRVAVELV